MCLLSEPEEEREEDQRADLPAGRGQEEPREDAGQLHKQRLWWRKSEISKSTGQLQQLLWRRKA